MKPAGPTVSLRLRRAVHVLAHRSGVSLFRAQRQSGARVLKFHGVGGVEYAAPRLETQLRYLARHFTIVPLGWILKRVAAGGELDAGEIALTFDDGLRNNATVAVPILARLGLPATFFVCPGLIDGGRWLWNHEARARLRTLGADQRAGLARQVGGASADVEALIGWMKRLPSPARERVQAEIRAATGHFRPTPEDHARFDVMTWSDVAGLPVEFIELGAHTMTHPSLPTLDGAESQWEIAQSRHSLEARTGHPVEHFCYPFGDWNGAVVDGVRPWYRGAVSSHAGRVEAGADPYRLRRISATPSLARLTWLLHRPGR